MTLNRRTLMASAIGVAVAPAEGRTAAATAFSFVFLTDTHIEPELQAADGCLQCFRHIARENIDFVIHGGDHVYDALEVGAARAERQRDLYCQTEKALPQKVYHVIGNHDCFGVFAQSGVTPAAAGYGKAYYAAAFGERYYAFDHKGVHFIVLDSIGLTADRSYRGYVDPEQIAWLQRDLATTPADAPIILATHIPLVTGLSCYEPVAWTKTPHNWTNVDNARQVLALLRGRNLLAVLQGHSHVAEILTLNGTAFITGGAVSGNWWEGNWLGTGEGYMHVTVADGRIQAEYRGYGFVCRQPKDVPIAPA